MPQILAPTSMEDFELEKDVDTKLNLLFRSIAYSDENIKEHLAGHCKAIEKLKKGRKIDKIYAFGGGVLGGITTTVGKHIFGR